MNAIGTGRLHGAALEIQGRLIDRDIAGLSAVGIEGRITVQHVIIGGCTAVNVQHFAWVQNPGMT
ncbi:hypothetical protein D3C84_687640 [compost metagenome]